MKKTLAYVTFTVLAGILFLTGCSSVPRASVEQDIQAKRFEPPQEKGALYIFRDEPIMGIGRELALQINGLTVGATSERTYAMFNLIPGRYYIESRGENMVQMPLDLAAGKNHFVWQEVKTGWNYPRTNLRLVDEKEGRERVLTCERIEAFVRESDLKPMN